MHKVRRAAHRVVVHRHDRVDQGAWHEARAQQRSLAPDAGGHTLLPVCVDGHGTMGRVLMCSDQLAEVLHTQRAGRRVSAHENRM